MCCWGGGPSCGLVWGAWLLWLQCVSIEHYEDGKAFPGSSETYTHTRTRTPQTHTQSHGNYSQSQTVFSPEWSCVGGCRVFSALHSEVKGETVYSNCERLWAGAL